MICADCDKEYATDAQMRIHRHLEHGETGPPQNIDINDVEDDEPILTERPPSTESKPKRSTIRDKIRTRTHTPINSRSRESGAPLLSMAWAGLGTALIRTGADVPVGRCLQFQADTAGEVLDRLIARTFLDRLLQPLATNMSAMEELGSLLALPVLVGAIERNPEAGVALEPLLRMAVMANITAMGPVIKKRKADEAKFAKAVKDLDLGLPDGIDPVEAVLQSIFAPPPGMSAETVDAA